jgi:hypothetical protein
VTMRTMFLKEERMRGFTTAAPPDKHLDFDSRQQRIDPKSELPVWLVRVTVRNDDAFEAWVISVQVPARPEDIAPIAEGMVVAFENLTATPWDRDGRSGMTYRATMVVPATPTAPVPVPTPVAAASPGPETASAGRASGGRGGSS